jgi:chromosome partitioning protein
MQSVEATRRQINNKLRVLGVVVNCKDSHKIKIEDYHFDSLTEVYPNEVFDSVITSSVKVSEARSFNKSVRQHAPNSVQAKQFLDLTSEYLEKGGG